MSTSSAYHHLFVPPTGSFVSSDSLEDRARYGVLSKGWAVVAATTLFHVVEASLLSLVLSFLSRRCGVPATPVLRVVGTCCTRPWFQCACVRSEQLATVPSGTMCLSSSQTIRREWGSRSRGSLRSRRMRGWRPPDSGADKYWRQSSCTSPPATLSSPLPPLFPRVANIVMDWAALS